MFREVRDNNGRLLFRFDPERDLIEIRDRKRHIDAVVDLAQYRENGEPEEPVPII